MHRGGARRRLLATLLLTLGFLVIEAAAAVAIRSLALLSDAGHMLTDVVGLGMALAAIGLASRGLGRHHQTFGLYRLEILAALANAVLLIAVAAYVIFEAVRRLGNPPDIAAPVMLAVAGAGLAVNLAALTLLRGGAGKSLNVEAAILEVLGDALASAGVLGAAVVIQTTGWREADPLAAIVIGVVIVPRAWNLASRAVRILIQAAPPGIDLGAVRADLAALRGVVDVHDLHLWTLTSEMEVASAHIMVAAGTDSHGVLDQARLLLRERYHVAHATLQVEPDDHEGCEELSW